MKVNYCFLERFNNYFNRKLIRYTDLQDYEDNSQASFIPLNSDSSNPALFDFNPNDNITSEIIVNDVPFDPDYFLILDPEDESIMQRWFVLEQKRNRKGQWTYFLRRDVLADSFDQIKTAPVYVEKGIINDLSNPLLLNNEDLRVNQIKKEEILLKDRSKCAWLVMYLKKGALGNNSIGPDGNGIISLNVPQDDAFVYQTLSVPFSSWSFYQYVGSDYTVNKFNVFMLDTTPGLPAWLHQKWRAKFWDDNANFSLGNSENNNTNLEINKNYSELYTELPNAYLPQMSSLRSLALTAFNYKNLDTLMAYNDKVIKDSLGKYYKIHVVKVNSGTTTHPITANDAPSLKSAMTNIWNTAFNVSASPNDNVFSVKANWENWRITYDELSDITTSVDFSAYSGEGTKDSMLFDVIAIPYGAVRISNPSEYLYGIDSEAERSLVIMSSIATALTSQWVLDLQLLPYCPVQSLIQNDNPPTIIFTTQTNKTVLCGKYTDGGGVTHYTDAIFVCPNSNFTLDIETKIEISDNSNVGDNYKIKYLNDCTMIRLCSPNYNGLFEMNLAKNGGLINKFNVDITMKPFNPYIHVNPDFSFLYGQDFNDVRGLICGGDFSLGIINDAWNVYEIQNKNYQAIFDRQIQNLDLNNAIIRQESLWGAVAGTVQGTASGAITGGMASGSPYGAIAGAVIGGGASAIGGAMDIANLEKRQSEARNYAIDNFNLQLGNVRALPNSITKTSALTYNNKLFPFVEIYECSPEEKEAYYLKIKYNGMTISKISKMEDFTSLGEPNQNYFRARLIRIENISEDNHYVEIINEELMKGVFI